MVCSGCWGFDNAAAAQQAVLKQVVASLLKQVDCFGIQGMPAEYAEALSKTSTYLESTFKFIGSQDPDAQLRRVSPILEAINARLVVVIEDTDRKGGTFDTASIEGLLNRFRDVPGISFVVTAGTESRMDFMRLCEHTEVLPPLGVGLVPRMLSRVWTACREMFPEDIDLVKRDDSLAGPGDTFVSAFSQMTRGAWERQMAKLITTPRKLKATIRRFRNAWMALHGEVDIDELLVASCLRVCAPSVFGFLIRRHEELRHHVGTDLKSQPDPTLEAIKKEWSGLADADLDLETAGRLLQSLYPASCVLFDKASYEEVQSRQQFRSVTRPVYRDRIFNESTSAEAISDQAVLQAIANAKKLDRGWAHIAMRLVESEGYLEVFEYFQPLLVIGDDLWKLTGEVLAVVQRKYGNKAGRDSPAIPNLCRMCFKHFGTWPDYLDRASELIKPCIPKNLELVTGASSYLFNETQNDARTKFAHGVMATLKEALTTKGYAELGEGLNELVPVTLHDLLTLDRVPGERKAGSWKEWAWLGPILLDGIANAPQKFVPQVSHAIGLSFAHPELPSNFIVNEAPLQDLFGPRAKELMSNLSKPFPINPELDQAKYQIDLSLVVPRAQRWLTKHESE